MRNGMKQAIVWSLLASLIQSGASVALAQTVLRHEQEPQQQQVRERDQERQEKERQEKEKEEKERQERERQDRQRQEQDRQRQEQDRQRQERERQDRQRQEQDRQRQEQDRQRQERERQDRQRQEQDRQRQEQDRQRQERERQDRQRQEEDRQRQERERQDRQRWLRNERHHDWSHPDYRDSSWRRTDFSLYEPSPFRWHESRHDMHERFLTTDYRLEPIYDRGWERRFPGLHPYRWHDSHRYNQGFFWYRGVRIHEAVLFFDDWDELVGIGFMFDGAFIFIRDDHDAYEHHDALLLALVWLVFSH